MRKVTLIAENGHLKGKLEALEAENTRLQEQNEKLQLALLSKVSPPVYDDIRFKNNTVEEDEPTPPTSQHLEFLDKLRNEQMNPLFADADEFIKTVFPGETPLANRLEEQF